MTRINPCLNCGACCAFFRVSFYWGETTDDPDGTVPTQLTEDINSFFRAMKGSNQKNPRCIALEGEIGEVVFCSIYEQRSSACRSFALGFQNGEIIEKSEDYERCTRARAHWGMQPVKAETSQGVPEAPMRRAPWPITPRRKRKKQRKTSQHPLDQNPSFPPPV